jgi:hypothetical protein
MRWMGSGFAIFGVLTAGSLAAEGGPFDLVHCYGGETQAISHAEGREFGTLRLLGTVREGTGIFGMASSRCVGVWSLLDGRYESIGYCEFADPDGDKYFGQYTRDGPNGLWRLISGTGKFADITMSGEFKSLGNFPSLPGAFHACIELSGTYKRR